MGLITEKVKSNILGKTMNLSVYCPDGYEKADLPVLYFLHGRTGDERLLQQLEMDAAADALIKAGEIKPLRIVGFAAFNLWFHHLTGVHMAVYTITDWLGLVPIAVCLGFGVTGVYQTPKGYYVDDADVEEFDKAFPPKVKLKLPGQIFD